MFDERIETLDRLARLRDAGALTEREYACEHARLVRDEAATAMVEAVGHRGLIFRLLVGGSLAAALLALVAAIRGV